MNIILLTLIIIGLILHNYLSFFWENGNLPYSHGFTAMAGLFFLLYLIKKYEKDGIRKSKYRKKIF